MEHEQILGLFILSFVFILPLYIYMSYALMTIAKKTKTQKTWFAWVPILNVILMLWVAKKPVWWIVLSLVPFVSIVIMVIVWMKIAAAVKKPEWLGILMLVPIANLVVPGYLAWSK